MIVDNLRFAEDSDLLELEPNLDIYWPRVDQAGKTRRSWDVQHRLAMDEIERRLRASKSTAEPIELGRLGLRTKMRLKVVAACFALHFIFVAADTHGDESGFFARKANLYYQRGNDYLEDEIEMVDYDADNSGTIDDFEKNQPLPRRFLRG